MAFILGTHEIIMGRLHKLVCKYSWKKSKKNNKMDFFIN